MVSMPTMTDAEPSLTKEAARVIASKDIQNIVILLSVVEVIADPSWQLVQTGRVVFV